MIEFFSYGFIERAMIVGALVSLCAALLGAILVLKRYSMIGDGLSRCCCKLNTNVFCFAYDDYLSICIVKTFFIIKQQNEW